MEIRSKRRQSSLNSINRTIAQWTSSSRFLLHLYLDFRRFLSTIFLLVATDWSVEQLHLRRFQRGSAIWVIAGIGFKKHDLLESFKLRFHFLHSVFAHTNTIVNSGGEMKRCDRNRFILIFFFIFPMAIKMLCDCICHRPMIGIALFLEALTAILHWLCGDETHQCSAFVSVFGRIASGCMICHFFAFGRRLSPRRALIGALIEMKKLKFEKTWHMTDKDSHHRQQSQRQHDLFIYSDFVIWLKKSTANATFSLRQTYKCACLCVCGCPGESRFLFFSRLSICRLNRTDKQTQERTTTTKKTVVNQSWANNDFYLLVTSHIHCNRIEMAMTPPDNTIAYTMATVAQSKISFGPTLIVLKQTNNEIVASKIDRRSQRTKAAQKSWSHWARHWDGYISPRVYLLLGKRLDKRRKKMRENYGMRPR